MTGVLLPADLPVPIEVMVGKHLLFSVGLIVGNGLIVRNYPASPLAILYFWQFWEIEEKLFFSPQLAASGGCGLTQGAVGFHLKQKIVKLMLWDIKLKFPKRRAPPLFGFDVGKGPTKSHTIPLYLLFKPLMFSHLQGEKLINVDSFRVASSRLKPDT